MRLVERKVERNASEEIHYGCEPGGSWVDSGVQQRKARRRERTAE